MAVSPPGKADQLGAFLTLKPTLAAASFFTRTTFIQPISRGHKCIILPGTVAGAADTAVKKRASGAGGGGAAGEKGLPVTSDCFNPGPVLLALFSFPVLYYRKIHISQL